MSKNKATTLVSAVAVSTMLLSGCGLFGTETTKKIDPPQKVTVVNKPISKETSGKTETPKEGVKTELYLIDKNGYVVPQTLTLPNKTSVAKQALEYLVANGPGEDMLPNGFRAVLPEDTSLSVDIAKDGVATVNFSKEFKNYQAADEQKILQSITWTLTQFNNVKSVKLKMNGQELTKMPVKGTPINGNLTRAMGINIDTTDVLDITNTRPMTVYYIGGEEDAYYYVPVTLRINNNVTDNVAAAVNALVNGPSNNNLVSEFMQDVKLNGTPKVDGGKVTLDFNKNIYGSMEKNVISKALLDELVLSLTEQKGIEKVAVTVNGKASLVDENGKKLTEPVMRPDKVNTESF
jgi:germination protein M